MHSHALRRTITACASVLLVLGFIGFTSSPSQAEDGMGGVSGKVETTTGRDVADVAVRFYRSTGDPDEPWTLVATTYSSHASDEEGSYDVDLPLGTYRMTFNEFDDGGVAWDAWTSSTAGIDFPDGPVTEFTLDADRPFRYLTGELDYKGGLITGHLKDDRGRDVSGARIEVYDASSTPDLNVQGSGSALRTYSDSDGSYEIHALGGPTKIRFYAAWSVGTAHVNEWYDDSPSFESASALSVSAGETSAGHDALLIYTPPPHVKGRVVDPEGHPLPGIHITRYKATGDVSNPWGASNGGDSYDDIYGNAPERTGTFDSTLENGTYKLGFNLDYQGNPESHFWKGYYYGGADTLAGATPFDVKNGDVQDLADIRMGYAGGSVEGRITDVFGAPVTGAVVESHDASGESLKTLTDSNGHYTAHTGTGSTKISVLTPTANYMAPAWVGGAADVDHAQGFLLTPADHVTAADLVLKSLPIKLFEAPRVEGLAKPGRKLYATDDDWAPDNVTKKYQWYQRKAGKTTTMKGSTKSYITIRSTDYGKQFRCKVTASHPGTPSRSSTSNFSQQVRRDSHVSLSGSSPSKGKVKLKFSVKVNGIAHPRGTVTIHYGGTAYQYAKSKRVSFKDGHGSVTLTGLRRYSTGFEVLLPATATVDRASAYRRITVR